MFKYMLNSSCFFKKRKAQRIFTTNIYIYNTIIIKEKHKLIYFFNIYVYIKRDTSIKQLSVLSKQCFRSASITYTLAFVNTGACVAVEDKMRSKRYMFFMAAFRNVIPELSEKFQRGASIFQLDRVPCHNSTGVKKFPMDN